MPSIQVCFVSCVVSFNKSCAKYVLKYGIEIATLNFDICFPNV